MMKMQHSALKYLPMVRDGTWCTTSSCHDPSAPSSDLTLYVLGLSLSQAPFPMARAVFSASTSLELERLSEKHGIRTPLQLGTEERSFSASRWSLKHLIAYRLLISPEREFLPTFKSDHDNQCPVCIATSHDSQQQVHSQRTREFTQDPCPVNIVGSTESELMRHQNGPFWIALARAMEFGQTETKNHPQRERKDLERIDFVNSTTAIMDSSSPSSLSSSSEYKMSIDSVDEDEYEARRSKPEEVTVHLVTTFLQQSLYLCLDQDFEGSTEIRARVERQRSAMRVHGSKDIVAEDDGGICRMEREGLAWGMDHAYLALIEAKKAFKHLHIDEATGSVKPVVSNAMLAQCLGEAIVSWMANRQLIRQDVFLIMAVSTFLRFVHFHFGSHYAEFLESEDEAALEALLADSDKDTHVHMQSSKWINLQSSRGRRTALCHVLSLLRWHDNEQTLYASMTEANSPVPSNDSDEFMD